MILWKDFCPISNYNSFSWPRVVLTLHSFCESLLDFLGGFLSQSYFEHKAFFTVLVDHGNLLFDTAGFSSIT